MVRLLEGGRRVTWRGPAGDPEQALDVLLTDCIAAAQQHRHLYRYFHPGGEPRGSVPPCLRPAVKTTGMETTPVMRRFPG